MIVPTLRCNAKCIYCQVSSKSAEALKYDMNEATAKRIVDLIFLSPSPGIKIEFQGGEPLLNFKLVLQNPVIDGVSLSATIKKPFSYFAEEPYHHIWGE